MKTNHATQACGRLLAAGGMVLMLAACGGKEEPVVEAPAKPAARAVETRPSATKNDPDARMANAISTGKTAAGVDLKYDVQTKPQPGQEFEVELAFLPRLPADVLEVEASGIPGLEVLGGTTERFEHVVPGERYVFRARLRADAEGLYYFGVTARMVTQVQTDARGFSVPLVVGVPAAAEKPQPVQDAAGQPIESLPATEADPETP